jgi:hypothetical protein
MTNDMQQEEAPELGEPTDAAVDDETAALLMNGEKPTADVEAGSSDDEQTMETPDQLGGTGGEQAGGAG